MLKVIIVEDEVYSREVLIKLLLDYCEDDINILGEASSVDEGIEVVKRLQPDLVFLDIEIQKQSGFDLLERLNNHTFEVIFTTAYEHYALRALKASAIDYLLKPIDILELQEAVSKALLFKNERQSEQKIKALLDNISGNHSESNTIALRTNEGYKFVNVKEIFYCEADGPYTYLNLKSGEKVIQSKNLKEYEKMFVENDFLRIHHSFLVNKNEIDRFVKSKTSYVIMKDGTRINVSAKRRDEFLKKMGLK